jgi:hypothetical protein
MGEKDDPYRMDRGLEHDLKEQLRRAIENSQNPPQQPEWSAEEEAALRAELSRIPFNPQHANPDFADRKLKIEGEEADAHAAGNFPLILSVMERLSSAEGPISLNRAEEIYASSAEARRYPEIADWLRTAYPAVYKRTIQIARDQMPIDPRGRELTQDEVLYIKSQAYGAAAAFAKSLDPDYNLALLR